MSPFTADLGLFCLGSLRLGTFGIVRGFGFFFFFLRIKFGFVISVLRFVFVFVILKVKIKKSEIFVFVFGFLVATLFRLKNMIWGFCFWVSNLG